MRAFQVTWRALASFYSELFLLVAVSAIWWGTGGIFVGLAAFLGYPLLVAGGPWWLAPLLAIPAGPAWMGLATVTRRMIQRKHVDRSFYFEGLRQWWRQGLGINAISMAVLAILLLNFLFYLSQPQPILRMLSVLWIYLSLIWISAQLYVYPVLLSLEEPTVLRALRTAIMLALANPLFSLLGALLALALSAISVVLAILVVLAWPALMSLMGQHSVRLFLERAGLVEPEPE